MRESSVTPTVEAQDGPPVVDGRSVRAERTRRAVVDALLTLNDEGSLQPTARDIAERAGVSVRSLYVHFDDLDALMLAASERHRERLEAALPPIVAEGPLPDRLDGFAARRATLHEAGAGPYRAAVLQVPSSPALRSAMAAGRKLLRAEVRHCFAAELGAMAPARRHAVLTAVDLVSSSAAWEHLRTNLGLTADEARRQLRATVLTLLTAWTDAPGPTTPPAGAPTDTTEDATP